MSPIDPRELKKAGRTYIDVIETDRLCGKCRYNLRGLPTNGRCPECGHPVRGGGRSGFKRFSDNLVEAPLFYLKTLAVGAWLLALAGVAMTVTFHFTRQTWDVRWGIGASACALLWWVGVFIVSAPRIFGDNTLRDEALDGPHLRLINRSVNLAWVLAGAAWVIVARAPVGSPMESYARLAASILMVIGIVGLVTLGLQLAALADWAGDSALAERFRTTAWIMGAAVLASLIAAIASRTTGPLSNILSMASLLVFIIGCLALLFFNWALIQLAGIATWAINNNTTADATGRRVQQLRDRREQDMADRTALAIALQDAAPPPNVGSDARAQTAFENNRLDRSKGGAAPYDIVPDTADTAPAPDAQVKKSGR